MTSFSSRYTVLLTGALLAVPLTACDFLDGDDDQAEGGETSGSDEGGTTGGAGEETGATSGAGESGEDSAESGAESESGGDEGGDGTWPEALPVDCTSPNEDPACLPPRHGEPGAVGSGPAFITDNLFPSITGGALDPDRDVLLVTTKSGVDGEPQGFLAEVDLHTGDRTIISGSYRDTTTSPPHTFGDGIAVGYFYNAAAGGGAYYAAVELREGTENVYGIVKIDPTTGTRTLHWRSEDDTCKFPNGDDVRNFREGVITAGPDGTLYHAFGTLGIAAITSPTECTVVSNGSGDPAQTVGGGHEQTGGYYRSITWGDGALWGLEWQAETLIKVDPTTGDRVVVSSSSTISPVGSGPDLPNQRVAHDGSSVYLYTGAEGTVIGTVNESDGYRSLFTIDSDGPARISEDDPLFTAHKKAGWLLMSADGGIVVIDTKTGNSNVLSF